MPEIKIKHVVSFSSEDKVHKAENLLKPETYRKWKCATAGEKSVSIILQFEKAMKIHSIDIGNEHSAFVEVLVGRSSDSVNDYQVLLVASSFMSPLESRNGTHTNRVRMFGPEKLSQNTKDEKWDCVQVICTQPFNKNVTYGLTFISFHSTPEKNEEQLDIAGKEKPVTKLGAFKLRDEEDEDDSLPSIGSFFGKQRTRVSESSSAAIDQAAPSYATAVLASSNSASKGSSQENSLKRKVIEKSDVSEEPPAKKTSLNEEHIVYKDVLRDTPENKKVSDVNKTVKKDAPSPKVKEKKKDPATPTVSNKQAANNIPVKTSRSKVPFNKIMGRVVFVLSGFVNPLRSELRDKALEMGAKYKPDWDASCTHLVCAFVKTPKYDQVKKLNGRIVAKEWILDCHKKKELLLWRRYELASDSSDEMDKSDEHDDSDDDPNFIDDGGDEESDESVIEVSEDEESDEFVVDDSEDEYSGKKKKKKNISKTKIKRQKANNTPSKKKPQSPNVRNKTAKNTAVSNGKVLSNTPTKKRHFLSDSEEESSSPQKKSSTPTRKKYSNEEEPNASKKKDGFSIFGKLKQFQQKDASDDNSRSPSVLKANVDSETEDEEAIQDYIADTDVEDDSGGDTEDEIRKVEAKAQKKAKMNGVNRGMEISEKPDVSDLPLPELPDFFKKRRFFLYGDFLPSRQHQLERYITAYNGVIEEYMNDKIKYVITEKKWDSHFEDALSENEDLIFVKPAWIYKCHDAGKLVPYQSYIVIPDT